MNQLNHRGAKRISRWLSGVGVATTRDLPTIAFFRAGVLLRRSVPVPGILATHRPGAIMDKSGRQFVARSDWGANAPLRTQRAKTFSQLLTKRKPGPHTKKPTLPLKKNKTRSTRLSPREISE